jgi:hypothetical protein
VADDPSRTAARVEASVERALQADHAWLPAAVATAAREVLSPHVAELPDDAPAVDRGDGDPSPPAQGRTDSPSGPLRSALDDAGVLDRCPAVLAALVDAAGFDLPFEPAPAPPYVVVTSEGLLLRATVATGRLVVAVRAVEVRRRRPQEPTIDPDADRTPSPDTPRSSARYVPMSTPSVAVTFHPASDRP